MYPGNYKHLQQLQDLIDQLQTDVARSQNEATNLSNQLECLILLVKKSWTGDPIANRHLARIIGVAPPKFEVREEDESRVMLTVTPKTRSLQNWVRLTVGLLNQEYKRQESELHEQQNMYLHSRIVFLDDQMNSNDQPYILLDDEHSVSSARSSGRPLYRNEDQETKKQFSRKPSWTQSLTESQTKLNKTKLFEMEWNYAGLKNTKKPTKKRPVSATYTKPSIPSSRTRPASAVTRNDRPMKYETTRPLPDKPKQVPDKSRPVSDKPIRNINSATVRSPKFNRKEDANKTSTKDSKPFSEFERKVFLHQKDLLDKKIYEELDHGEIPLEQRMKAPESVTKFEDDLQEMSNLERQFKRSTIDLQRKLGIQKNGMI